MRLGGFATELRRRRGFHAPEIGFSFSAEQAAALIGPEAPEVPASLAEAFYDFMQRIRDVQLP